MAHGKKHFGCDTFNGLHLENGGDMSSVGSHWEKILLGNEMMTSEKIGHSPLSLFSLHFLQDSGWYDINLELAEKLICGIHIVQVLLD